MRGPGHLGVLPSINTMAEALVDVYDALEGTEFGALGLGFRI